MDTIGTLFYILFFGIMLVAIIAPKIFKDDQTKDNW